ncbi:MAG: hypothetical protein V1799_01815 [bacterium]
MQDSEQQVGAILECIERQLPRLPRVKEIAAELKKHPSDIENVFHFVKQKNLKKYLDDRGKECVVRFLKETDFIGHRIAIEMGFASYRSFYQWVKRVFGKCFEEVVIEHRCTRKQTNKQTG